MTGEGMLVVGMVMVILTILCSVGGTVALALVL